MDKVVDKLLGHVLDLQAANVRIGHLIAACLERIDVLEVCVCLAGKNGRLGVLARIDALECVVKDQRDELIRLGKKEA